MATSSYKQGWAESLAGQLQTQEEGKKAVLEIIVFEGSPWERPEMEIKWLKERVRTFLHHSKIQMMTTAY